MKEEQIKQNLSKNIKILRKKLNLSQKDFANKLNVSLQKEQRWESGISKIKLDDLVNLCFVFKICVDNILKDSKTFEKYLTTTKLKF